MTVANVDGASLRLNALVLEDIFTTQEKLKVVVLQVRSTALPLRCVFLPPVSC